MSTLRFKVVEEAYGRKAVPVEICTVTLTGAPTLRW